jgi:hypothetical protein
VAPEVLEEILPFIVTSMVTFPAAIVSLARKASTAFAESFCPFKNPKPSYILRAM